eukprot:COSAG02_NODE_37472_length_441_cov_1.140351_1_plen_54_part_10
MRSDPALSWFACDLIGPADRSVVSECERARARACDLITKGLQQALLVVHTPPFV